MKFLVARLLVCGVLVFALGAEAGQAAVVRVPATPVDTYIRDGSFANTNFFATTLSVGSSTTASTKRRSLLVFPVADYLPAGASVTSATMGLYISARSTTKAISVGAYALTRAWKDSVTWNSAAAGTAWTTAGGDYQATALSTNSSVGGALGTASWPIPAATVTAWANPSGANLGVLVKQTTEGGANSNVLTIESADASDTTRRPYVDVTYTPSTQTPVPAALAFIGTHDLGAPKGVWAANADGTSPRLLVPGSSASPAGGLGLALSPDGNSVAYSANNKVFVKSVATGNTTMVYNGPTPGEVRGVHFAPQGNYLIFTADVTSSSIGRVLTVNTDGTQLTLVLIAAPAGGYPRDVSFAPDGQHITFVSSQSQQGYGTGVWVADDDGQNPRPVVSTDVFTRDLTIRQPRFDPFGERISYLRGGKLRSVAFNGSGDYAESAVPVGRTPTAPDWAPDNSRLYYEWNASGVTFGVASIDASNVTSTDLLTSFALTASPTARQPVYDGSDGAADEDPDTPTDASVYDDGTCYDDAENPISCPLSRAAPAPSLSAPLTGSALIGISDSNLTAKIDIFSNPQYLALPATFVRRIVPWNIAVATDPKDAFLGDLETWVSRAHAKGKSVMISLDHCLADTYTRTDGGVPDPSITDIGKSLPCRPTNDQTLTGSQCGACRTTTGNNHILMIARPPTVAEYKQAVHALVTRSGLADVAEYTAWNEPNLINKQPTAATADESAKLKTMYDPATAPFSFGGAPIDKARARLAGAYYKALYNECALRTSSQCTVIAGDFSDKNMRNATNAGSIGGKYFRSYRTAIQKPPDAWAWHAYTDIQVVSGGAPVNPLNYPRLESFLQATSTNTTTHSGPRVLLTEQGVIRRKSLIAVRGLAESATMDRFLHLATDADLYTTARIQRLNYYAMLGDDRWDSGLLNFATAPSYQSQPIYQQLLTYMQTH